MGAVEQLQSISLNRFVIISFREILFVAYRGFVFALTSTALRYMILNINLFVKYGIYI